MKLYSNVTISEKYPQNKTIAHASAVNAKAALWRFFDPSFFLKT